MVRICLFQLLIVFLILYHKHIKKHLEDGGVGKPLLKKTEIWYLSSKSILDFFVLLQIMKRPLPPIGFGHIGFGLEVVAHPHPLHKQQEIEYPNGECQR